MTAEKLHKLMTVKVIPEKLIPQNIVSFLMDENAELPELDTFTFLNRLRALGISSTDFINLLNGCGAPREAVEKIARNPAMNLQSLIVTLNGAGLNSKDYTRMLYTARQLWEHTVTMRINSVRKDEEYAESFRGNELDGAEDHDNSDAVNTESYGEEELAEDTQTGGAEDYDNDSFVNAESYSEDGLAEDTQTVEAEDYDNGGFVNAESYSEEELAENTETVGTDYYDKPSDSAEEDDAFTDISKTAVHRFYTDDSIARDNAENESGDSGTVLENASDTGNTSTFAAIDINEIKRALNKPSEENESGSSGQTDPMPVGKQKPSEKPYIPIRGGYHNGAITVWAAGAAVLFALGAVISTMDFEQRESSPVLAYAESEEDIFAGFYNSYNNDVIGAEVPEQVRDCTVFGDLLIRHGDGLCSVTAGEYAYAAGKDGVDVYSLEDLSYSGEIIPPKGTEFFRVFVWEDSVYAVFEGDHCGFMQLSGADAAFTSVQSGTLTDVEISGGKIRLGSVYVPNFTESFDASGTNKYLPYISTQKDKISPQNVLLGGKGCGFAVSAEYSLKNGKAAEEKAVMCAPVFASADGRVAVTENSVIYLTEENAETASTGRITACAYEDGLLAAYEENETESMVVLRGADMQPVSAINNFSGHVTSLRLEDKTLYVYGENGLLIAADCSDPSTPKVLKLTEKTGTLKDGYAVCTEITGNGLVITAYDKNGETARYEKLLTTAERGTLEFTGSSAIIVNDGIFGASYERFDGVCKVSEYAVFGKENHVYELYDDETGYTAAFYGKDGLYLVSGAGIYRADNPPDTPYR